MVSNEVEDHLWFHFDGPRCIRKDNPETCHHNFDPSQRELKCREREKHVSFGKIILCLNKLVLLYAYYNMHFCLFNSMQVSLVIVNVTHVNNFWLQTFILAKVSSYFYLNEGRFMINIFKYAFYLAEQRNFVFILNSNFMFKNTQEKKLHEDLHCNTIFLTNINTLYCYIIILGTEYSS